MQQIDVKLPNVSNVNLKAYNAIQYLHGCEEVHTEQVITFLSNYLNIEKFVLENTAMPDVNELYKRTLETIDQIKAPEKPCESLTVNGNEYELVTFSELPAIWYMTVQKCLAKGIQAHEVAAFCYLEKGKTWQTGNYEKRKNEFEEHMTASQFFPLNAFFLEKYKLWREPFLELQRAKAMQYRMRTK